MTRTLFLIVMGLLTVAFLYCTLRLASKEDIEMEKQNLKEENQDERKEI